MLKSGRHPVVVCCEVLVLVVELVALLTLSKVADRCWYFGFCHLFHLVVVTFSHKIAGLVVAFGGRAACALV